MNESELQSFGKENSFALQFCLKTSKTNQNFSELQPDNLCCQIKLCSFCSFSCQLFHLFDTGLFLRHWSLICSERQTEELLLFLPMEITVSPAAAFLTNPRACSDVTCTCPVTTLPTGYHSLEGTFVAMERNRLVSKARPAWKD